MTAKLAAIVLGIVFVLIGLLGFFNNPVLGLFQVNTAHNLVHIVSGLVLLAGAYSSLGSGMALKIIGVVYAIIAIVGFFLVSADGMLLGFIAMNEADKWLHVVLAIVILAAGFGLRDDDARMAM
ncbi:MAG TPA: DUF4383 domain-containing protein [Bauldia sp.]|nr:DUF4383 domain-containing protein [Bauldia sp.]